jgi:hypothetical protein
MIILTKKERGNKMKKLSCLIALLLAFFMLLCFAGCTQKPTASSDDASPGSPTKTDSPAATEPEPAEEPSFVEHQSIQSALPSPGDATVTLTADETVDLTGIPLSGRKEIILNGHTLTLTGAYGVSPDAVLDIKPGEAEVGTINLKELTFDFGFLSEELPPEKALVEIRPGVTIGGEPQYPEGVSIREFPDILTVIQCD